MATQRTHATEGTQVHADLANQKMNIRYYIEVGGMDRAKAKKLVEGMVKAGRPLKTNEEVNRAIIAEKKRQDNIVKREAARKAQAEKEAKEKADEEARQKQWETLARKAQEAKHGFVGPEQEPRKREAANKSINVTINGVGYSSICAGMKAVGIPDKGTKNWFKIRAALKKDGKINFKFNGTVYTFIQL